MLRRVLLLWMLLTVCAQVFGQDYEVLGEGSQRWMPAQAGTIEVVEIFSYTCRHCADFHPMIEAWKQRAPSQVRVSYVPAAYDLQDPYARAYFAAEQAGVLDRVHGALFSAIHQEGLLPSRRATVDELAAYFGNLGLDRARMAALMNSPGIDAEMQRARNFAVANRVGSTPAVVVDGRYLLNGRSAEDRLRILDELVARLAGSQ